MLTASASRSFAQSLIPAGDVILNVQSVDLDPAKTVWTNQSIDAFLVSGI